METKEKGRDEAYMEEQEGQENEVAEEFTEAEKYWRTQIAEEIAEYKVRTKKYWQKRGELSQEQFVRLNIFGLCEQIALKKGK
jgi:hypothetical protein